MNIILARQKVTGCLKSQMEKEKYCMISHTSHTKNTIRISEYNKKEVDSLIQRVLVTNKEREEWRGRGVRSTSY